MMPPAEHIGGKVQMADVREENFKTGNYTDAQTMSFQLLSENFCKGIFRFDDFLSFFYTL